MKGGWKEEVERLCDGVATKYLSTFAFICHRRAFNKYPNLPPSYINTTIVNVANYCSKSSSAIVPSCTHFTGRDASCRKYLSSRFGPGWRRKPFRRETLNGTIGVRAEEFLTLRELPWQQWQAVINPRREWRRMVERGGEEEETNEQTDGPTLPRSSRQFLILSFSLPPSSLLSPVADARLPIFLPCLPAGRCARAFLPFISLSRRFAARKREAYRSIRRGFHRTSILPPFDPCPPLSFSFFDVLSHPPFLADVANFVPSSFPLYYFHY